MAKQKKQEGAPAYMALFCGLMTILLAFFILLNTMTEEQESGYNKGMGMVRNSFGLKGGFGLLKYMKVVQGLRNDNPEQTEGTWGTEDKKIKGEGGTGNSDQTVEEHPLDNYIRVEVKYKFDKGSYNVKPDLASYLDSIGTNFSIFDYKLNIRVYTGDFEGENENRELAMKRAIRIMMYLNGRNGVSLNNMRAVGYTHYRYFREKKPKTKQLIYFYVYRKKNPNN
ncbi:MAG: OmpA family protein [Lentisphaeria bacterium]|nr:hypothetical protein [Lentisphaeria bacterium]NQZ70177.1 OmpA family protein [Lentisphaeria bacterium]